MVGYATAVLLLSYGLSVAATWGAGEVGPNRTNLALGLILAVLLLGIWFGAGWARIGLIVLLSLWVLLLTCLMLLMFLMFLANPFADWAALGGNRGGRTKDLGEALLMLGLFASTLVALAAPSTAAFMARRRGD